MLRFIVDLWKDGELVQSVAGRWTEDEARKLTVYNLGYYRADRAELRRECVREGQDVRDDLIWEVEAPLHAGETLLW